MDGRQSPAASRQPWRWRVNSPKNIRMIRWDWRWPRKRLARKIKDALAHADKGGRNGKILVSPNGAI